MIIFDKQKLVFIAIPKTASTAIHHAYNAKSAEPDDYHMTIPRFLIRYPEKKDYTFFAFVRNPWDRLVSLFHDFKYNRKCQYSEQVKVAEPLMSEYKTFNDFVMDFPRSKWNTDIHFKPQTEFISLRNNSVEIGRFENLEEDYNKICDKYGLEKKTLPVVRKSCRSNYKNYYTPHTQSFIAQYLKSDIERFNYEF